MAKAPDSSLPAREHKKYIVSGERVIFALNQHWLVVLEPVVTVAVALALVIWLDATLPGSAAQVTNIAWWVWFATILRAVYCLWEWRREWFIATDKRLLRVYGILDRQVAMMPLSKVTDMRYERTIPGRMLGYGTFVMESAGQVQALSEIEYVPNPDTNYRALVAEMFGVADKKADDEDPIEQEADGPTTLDDIPRIDPDRYRDLRAWDDRAHRYSPTRASAADSVFETTSSSRFGDYVDSGDGYDEEDTGPIRVGRR